MDLKCVLKHEELVHPTVAQPRTFGAAYEAKPAKVWIGTGRLHVRLQPATHKRPLHIAKWVLISGKLIEMGIRAQMGECWTGEASRKETLSRMNEGQSDVGMCCSARSGLGASKRHRLGFLSLSAGFWHARDSDATTSRCGWARNQAGTTSMFRLILAGTAVRNAQETVERNGDYVSFSPSYALFSTLTSELITSSDLTTSALNDRLLALLRSQLLLSL